MPEAIKKRDVKWDNVKFILIFLVVLGHIADIYAEVSFATGCLRFIIYTFHMPLFMFISGLFGKRNVDEKRYDKIFSFLVLYLFVKVLDFIAKWIVNGAKPAFHLFSDGSVPWYAFCLFAFSMLIIALKRVDKKYVFIFSILLALVAGYDNDIGDFLCLSRIIVFFPFYFAGYCLDPDKVKEKLSAKKMKIASVIIIAAAIAVTILCYDEIKDMKFLFSGRNPFGRVKPGYPLSFLLRLVCYAVSALMGCAVISLTPGGEKESVFSRVGARSLQIYALHFFFKTLWFGLVSDPLHIDGFFTSKLLVYELIVSVALTALCALPFWSGMFKKILKVPYRKGGEKDNLQIGGSV